MILDLAKKHTTLQKKSTSNDEWCGPCPVCGGRDRFVVWPAEGETGRFLCRKCGKSGDAAGFLMWVNHCSYAEACVELKFNPKPTRRLTGSTGTWRKRPESFRMDVASPGKASDAEAPREKTDATRQQSTDELPVVDSVEPAGSVTGFHEDVASHEKELIDPQLQISVDLVHGHDAPHAMTDAMTQKEDEEAPAFVIDQDCWAGCLHFYHRGDAWECRTLDGNYDLTSPDFVCPKTKPGFRYCLPVEMWPQPVGAGQ